MIASVRGTVLALAPDSAVVEVGGVGIAVHCTPGTLAGLRVGSAAALDTSLVVREDSLTLYGFADADEKSLFELLQTASGVGPRLAQAVLAVHSPDAVRRAVATSDLRALTLVPGIGRKGAERLVLELKDRIGSVTGSDTTTGAGVVAPPAWQEQVRDGLVGLGWSAKEAEQAVAKVAGEVAHERGDAESDAGDVSPAEIAGLLKRALRLLGGAR
jgi:Holliday junction DNA helicase RuvA